MNMSGGCSNNDNWIWILLIALLIMCCCGDGNPLFGNCCHNNECC